MEEFNFKCKVDIDLKTFEQIYRERNKIRINKKLKFFSFLLFSIILLFFKYTIVLGSIILFLIILTLFLPKIFPWTYISLYNTHFHLHNTQNYTINNDNLIIKTDNLYIKSSWDSVYSIKILENWIIIGFAGVPTMYIPQSELKKYKFHNNVIKYLELKKKRLDKLSYKINPKI